MLLVLVVVIALLVVTGLIASRRHYHVGTGEYAEHVREADEALERARAEDKGWDREALHAAARRALASERPGRAYDEVHLVLVEDRPGVGEDSAHLVATGSGGEARVVLRRHAGEWALDRVE